MCGCFLAETLNWKYISLIKVGNAIAQVINYYWQTEVTMQPNKNLLPLRWDSGKKRQTWVPAAYLHFIFFFFLVKHVPESLGLQAPRVLGAHDVSVCVCRSRELNFIFTDGKKQQLPVPAPREQSQLWLLPHDISMQWRISLFFFARGKWIHYPAARRGAGGCVTLGWFGFHTRVGVWANLRSHFHWCWHMRLPSETCLSNCNMLCRKIRLLMLQ